jgi:hypothetical protein
MSTSPPLIARSFARQALEGNPRALAALKRCRISAQRSTSAPLDIERLISRSDPCARSQVRYSITMIRGQTVVAISLSSLLDDITGMN